MNLSKILTPIFLCCCVYTSVFSKEPIGSSKQSLNLAAGSNDENLLQKDPFENAEFIKSVQARGNTRLTSTYNIIDNINGRQSNFNITQFSRLNLSGRISRTLNFNFGLRFNSNFLGYNDNFGDAEDQTVQGFVRTGAGGGSVALQERTSIGSFVFGLSAGINYYGGTLTYGGVGENLVNSNFRTPPNLIRTAQGFSVYERQFNQSALSSQPEVLVNGIISPNRAKGITLNYISNGGSGFNAINFIGITNSNRILSRLQRNIPIQLNSTTFFNKIYKLFNVNVFGQRAKYEIGITNQFITGMNAQTNGAPVNFYVHTFSLGRRTSPNGRPLSSEQFQPEYEIAFMRHTTPRPIINNNGPANETITSVAKGIVLRHAINGSLFGVDPLVVRLNMFHVDSGYINPNGGFVNTSPFTTRNSFGTRTLIFSLDRILPIDGIANNRQGINFQYGYQFNDILAKNDGLRITGGNEVSRQIKRSMLPIILNPFAFPGFNSRMIRTDRDLTGRPTNKLHFSSFEIDAKYLGKALNKDIYIQTYYLSYTTKSSFHLLPDMSNRSHVRSSSANIGVFYHLIEGFVPNISFTYSRLRGNSNTVLNTTSSSDGSTPTYAAKDLVSKTLSFGLNTHLNRDYLLALSYNLSQNEDLSSKNSRITISRINFILTYNFRAT